MAEVWNLDADNRRPIREEMLQVIFATPDTIKGGLKGPFIRTELPSGSIGAHGTCSFSFKAFNLLQV